MKSKQRILRARQLVVGIGMTLALALMLRYQPVKLEHEDLTEQASDWALCHSSSKVLVQDSWDDVRF